VRMKVEIFAECVDRHDDGWNAVMHCCANAVRVAKRITQKVSCWGIASGMQRRAKRVRCMQLLGRNEGLSGLPGIASG